MYIPGALMEEFSGQVFNEIRKFFIVEREGRAWPNSWLFYRLDESFNNLNFLNERFYISALNVSYFFNRHSIINYEEKFISSRGTEHGNYFSTIFLYPVLRFLLFDSSPVSQHLLSYRSTIYPGNRINLPYLYGTVSRTASVTNEPVKKGYGRLELWKTQHMWKKMR